LIKSELDKHGMKADLNVNNGPDVVFNFGEKNYCFDVLI